VRTLTLTRTPLRVSLFGGGTDLPDYYRAHGGRVLSLTIDKYVYVTVRARWDGAIGLSWTDTLAGGADEVAHPIVRAALQVTGVTGGCDIASMSDVPAGGSGLGSSSAFTVGLLHALYAATGRDADAATLAELACQVEIELLGSPIGKQDQYAVAVGGCNEYAFHPDDRVSVTEVPLPDAGLADLARHALVFATGRTRSTNHVLRDQRARIPATVHHLHAIKEIVAAGRDRLLGGDLPGVGALLHDGWQRKQRLSARINDDELDDWYGRALRAGAYGGKLLGAGGGGYFLFLAPPDAHPRVAAALPELRRMPVGFVPTGSHVVASLP
jgi:D-glycero-alpha-D-manno-heptose-7-phosphate kinase